MRDISVVTLNTWKCDGDYLRRLRLMSHQLGVIAPDILLLQESFRDEQGQFDTAEYLASQLGLNCNLHLARYKLRKFAGTDTGSWSCLAVLSRFVPVASGSIALADDPRDGERWAQWVDYKVDSFTLRVINTHLCHLAGREDLRQQELVQIVGAIADPGADHLVILGGDLNTTPHAPALRCLEESIHRPVPAWREGRDTGPLDTHPTWAPGTCLDHLYRFATPFVSAQWRKVGLAVNVPDTQGCYPSDHSAVIGKLVVDDQAVTGR